MKTIQGEYLKIDQGHVFSTRGPLRIAVNVDNVTDVTTLVLIYTSAMSRDSSGDVATKVWAVGMTHQGSIPVMYKRFLLFSKMSGGHRSSYPVGAVGENARALKLFTSIWC